ncbi:uncharacterized protein PRCAT00005010001 [Priceomyces carsonii]|uniref:uncharacterized protein n=1 Tax=Priceomyces carsonii TaxID=28549 RepID=UPI002ED8EB45|nr:unnamed protein product [Priceomyces carsonii]
MYIPNHYNEEEWDLKEQIIKKYPLGTLITSSKDGGIIANHIPFFLFQDESSGKYFLQAHIARKNHQIPSLKSEDNALVVFQSHDSYISPSYYATKQETHKVVPTWDFASVHVYGKPEIVDDAQFVRRQLENFTNQQEKKRAVPWAVDEAPEKYLNILQKSIIGLQIEIERTECKYKFEQKMKREDIDGVIEGLAKDNLPEVSEFVKSSNKKAEETVKS